MTRECWERRGLPGLSRGLAGVRPSDTADKLGQSWLALPLCRLQMTEAALALSEQKSQDLGELLATAEQERLSLTQREEKERRLEKQVEHMWAGRSGWPQCDQRHSPHTQLRKPQSGSPGSSETCLLPAKRTCCFETRYKGHGATHRGVQGGASWLAQLLPMLLAVQVDELERKLKSQQEELFLTRQELTNTSAELKIRITQAEGRHRQACH